MTQDPVIIVTGGGVGIGGAIVDRLLEKKAKVVVIDLVEGPVKQRQDSVGADKLQYVIGDVSKDEVNQKAVDAAINSWGKIDGVALNAGVMAPIERICDMKSAEVTKIFNINVVAHVSMVSLGHRRHARQVTKFPIALCRNSASQKIQRPSHLYLVRRGRAAAMESLGRLRGF